ncbi:MAG TPA: hypothetical protein VFB37_03145 [Steroidobacteraceae bacterium]|nr:hypothetical protein [Steroidobacteraceae bacterium]
MRRPFVLQTLLLSSMLFGDCAVAQRTYTFEEACRNAGWTTGPCAPQQQAQPLGCVPLGGNAFHAEAFSGNCIPATLSPALDAEIFIEMIGLPNIPKINELRLTIGRTSNQNNAFATFHNGGRLLIIDPVWARSGVEAYLIIGHEAGHHFCGHTLPGFKGRPKEAELEADRFSGASIKRFEIYHRRAFFTEALKAAERLYSEDGNRTHPPRAARINAITQGYLSGSPCGNLAPAIPGFSPSPR